MSPAIDIHVHLGPRWDDVKDVRASVDDLAAANGQAGVSSSVASSAESLLSRTALGAGDDGEKELRLAAGNDDLFALCRAVPWLRMAVVVDPGVDESLRQAERMLRDPRVVAVKLHPDRHRYRAGDHAGAVLRMLAGFPGKAMLVHCTGTTYSDPAPLIERAAEVGGVPVIIAHLGRIEPPDRVINLIRDRGARNVYVDTSALRDPGMVRRAIETIGAERILFGSDFPFYSPASIITLIRSCGAAERDIDRILSLNARELFGA
jgi:predicted TIM-barrel fold metal-dependent hydrolase